MGIAQQADESGVRVLFEDADVLAVAKEAGIATQPDSREETGAMVNLVIGYLRHAACRPYTGAPLGAVPGQRVRVQCRCAPLLRPSAAPLPLRLDHPRPSISGSGGCAVHRLDKQTSGVLLFAKTPKANSSLMRMFATREVLTAPRLSRLPGPRFRRTGGGGAVPMPDGIP